MLSLRSCQADTQGVTRTSFAFFPVPNIFLTVQIWYWQALDEILGQGAAPEAPCLDLEDRKVLGMSGLLRRQRILQAIWKVEWVPIFGRTSTRSSKYVIDFVCPAPPPTTATLEFNFAEFCLAILFGGVFMLVLFFSLLASWLLGGLSHPLHSQFLFGRWHFGFCGFSLVCGFWRLLAALAFCILCFPDVASRIISITSSFFFESSLLRTSWGASQPTRYCLDCLQSNCTPICINTSSNIMGGLPPPPRYFLDLSCRD